MDASKASTRMNHGWHPRYANGRSSRVLEAENRRLRVRVTELERQNTDGAGLVAVAAHELVEPLIATETYASIVAGRLEGDAHAESRSDLDTLRRGSAHARVLVEALLHHGEAAERPPRRAPIDVGLIVADSLRLLRPEVDFREVQLEIGELPVVAGEETLIRSLITNLVSNALKYGPRYGGTIAISATQLGGDWRFCVHSQGPTIPVADRERIFDAYRRGRGERRIRGAGLGLAICRQIVERHGGRIWVGPAHGTGNEFLFTLPA
jgi:two-component system, chemotaxis family, sensor kinase Cph1